MNDFILANLFAFTIPLLLQKLKKKDFNVQFNIASEHLVGPKATAVKQEDIQFSGCREKVQEVNTLTSILLPR